MANITQRQLIHDFNDKFRPKFNKALLKRTDAELIDAMRKVIYSCERDGAFTIKVVDFEVIDNYDDVNYILWDYEESIINKGKKSASKDSSKSSKSKKVNQFGFINLKDSALNLLKVTYFIQIVEKKDGLVNDTIVVYVAVPRIVDNFYFLLNGITYSAMYQIVDASTYNNSAAKNAKKQSITFKTIFQPIRVYRYQLALNDISGTSIPCTYFIGNMFRKSLLLMKYILAKMGLVNAATFLKCDDVKLVKEVHKYFGRDEFYIFPVRDLYIVCPRVLYDSVQIVQSFCYTLHSVVNYMRDASYQDFFNREVWIKALGAEFTSREIDTIYDKGLSILGSLEFIYDIITRDDLKLRDEDKSDIYRVLRWMMYEFNALRQKDNLDITTKKVRWAEYIAALYAVRLSNGIYRISDKGDKADLSTIRKAIQIPPMYLINAITKCKLVNYKSCVNDMDSIIALKYTYKGVSGIGEKSNAVSSAYRSIHPSHLGRVDIDSSSNSDPGISGTICPLTSIYDGHFEKYEEPSTWETEISKVIDAYRAIRSKVEMCKIVTDITKKDRSSYVQEQCALVARDLMAMPLYALSEAEDIPGVDIFGDGYFWFLEE